MAGTVARADSFTLRTTLEGKQRQCFGATGQLRCDGTLQLMQQQTKPALQGVGGIGGGRQASLDAMED